MKILLVHPNYQQSIGERSHISFFKKIDYKFITKPLNFDILSALTPDTHSIEVVDEKKNKIDFAKKYDLVGITSLTSDIVRAYEIADFFKERKIIVVMGGCHPSVMPEEAKQHADSVVIGEAEEIWPNLLRDAEFGMLKPFYRNENPISPDLIPVIDHKTNSDNSFIGRIQSTRGCNCSCEFCNILNLTNRDVFRKRPINDVVNELKNMPHKLLYFYDESLTLDVDYSKELFKKIKPLNKKYICNGNTDVLSSDDELIKLSKEAGCVIWAVGFESLSQKTIDSIGKTTNKVEDYPLVVEKIKENGLLIHGNFIFGFDDDTLEVFDKTFEIIDQWNLDSAEFNILMPFPGTRLFNRLDKENRLLTKNWTEYRYGNVVFQPKNMSPEELKTGVYDLLKRFYSKKKIVKRLISNFRLGFYHFSMTWLNNSSYL